MTTHSQEHIAFDAPQLAAPETNVTVPFFTTSFSYSGHTYPIEIVGANPATSTSTTTVANQIIPVKLTFSDGTVLNATNDVPIVTASPIYVNGTYLEGTTQYGDALMRSEFWNHTRTTGYHLLLGTPSIMSTASISVPAADGSVSTSGGVTTGHVSFQWFINTIEPQILTGRNVDPRTLTIFLTHHTLVLEPSGHCCFNGYHQSFPMTGLTYTTAWASVAPHDVTHLAHEVAEWMNDPFYTNKVPGWLDPGSTTTCGGHKLEVGDPLAGVIFSVNGFKVEDMTFYSWFARNVPSTGINGRYDMRGVLSGPAGVCP